MRVKMKAGMLVALVCLVLSLMAGCAGAAGGKAGDPGSTTNRAENESASKESSKEAVKIKFSYWGGPEEKKSMEAMLDKFNGAHPDIQVEGMHIAQDYVTKLNTMASYDTLPDLGYFPSGNLAVWVKNGKIADLSDLYNGGKIGKKLDSVLFRKSDGSIIGAGVANEILMLNYNKDLFDEATVPYPPAAADTAWTWDEFVAAAKKLTTDRNGKHPGAMTASMRTISGRSASTSRTSDNFTRRPCSATAPASCRTTSRRSESAPPNRSRRYRRSPI
ncbi:extracellular solute-binding protein [Paenibacillus mendelii]|uniref:Extracellular solute-binding protein n=1 Tax=Paenibacillus mendelii TaxID=206163 RepID=A0ABV6JAD0_9BACL|nr:extracellular solute-binding protein [Paenibacillus mendelii]MCQ6562189.1 extracellular solute-binding protein [Paenibacillus mendelii]